MATLSGFADQLRNSLDIVEVIGSYLPLKKRGKEYECICPFHQEKTPSFKVSPAKQIFHCFGCHKGGDVIRFVQEIEHLDFRAAVTLLAERHGIALPPFSDRGVSTEEEKHRKALYEVHQMAASWFAAHLAKDAGAAAYLQKRGIHDELVEAFGLGYAPDRRNAFLAFARQHGYSEGLLRDAGLIKDPGDGRGAYDAFRGRIVFPIWDSVGRVIAFGGRVLDGQVQPKYLNSPETAIYQKGQQLYAYHLAKNAIKERGFAIITEGYMDAIACHQYGLTNAVASLGTAFTDAMARLLRRVCSRVVFLYDGDEAGQRAMYRGTQVLLGQSLHVRVVALSAEDDPDSLLRREGREALVRRIESAPDHFDYFIQAAAREHDRATVEGRMAIVEFVKELVGRTSHPIARHDYARRLSEFLGIPGNVVERALFGHRPQAREMVAVAVSDHGKAERLDPHESALLRLLVEFDDARHAARGRIHAEWLFHPKVRSWYERILAAEPRSLALPAVLALAEDEGDAAFLRTVMLLESEPLADFERLYGEVVGYLESRYYDSLWCDLNRRIAEAERQGVESLLLDLCRERIECGRKRQLLREARYGSGCALPPTGSASPPV